MLFTQIILYVLHTAALIFWLFLFSNSLNLYFSLLLKSESIIRRVCGSTFYENNAILCLHVFGPIVRSPKEQKSNYISLLSWQIFFNAKDQNSASGRKQPFFFPLKNKEQFKMNRNQWISELEENVIASEIVLLPPTLHNNVQFAIMQPGFQPASQSKSAKFPTPQLDLWE